MMVANLRNFRESLGLSQIDFAKSLGLNKTTYNNYESGIRDPKSDFWEKVARTYSVTVDYLLGLTSDPHPKATTLLTAREAEHLKKYRTLGEYGKETVDIILNRELARDPAIPSPPNEPIPGKMIPFNRSIQPASAGTGAYLGPEEFETIFVQENPLTSRAAFGVPVSGDSMEPAYHNGDVLIVEKAEDIAPGEIGVFSIDNEGYVKQRGDNELISLNPDYGPIPMNDSIWCHGRVIGVLDPSWVLE